ncbi:centrosomal protein of 85 kDa-like isoform X2 [Clupea harengus]|uniref:Centrosomal protein of 85 kDa-like isoform X2 n=1 Tax=Clupea harengus TaxID=7950 RepID=A0A6P8GFJ6_CLUHA|nr:centrosomal protein of 85 kDa-like isoform X2 [Clupea harengus]
MKKAESSNTSSPGWVPGCESAWQTGTVTTGSSNRGRRHSTASDSGDTGIGTSCSDSVEDHSSSSTTLSYQHLRSGISGGSGPGGSAGSIPTAHVMPSTSSSSCVKLGVPGLLLSSSSVSTVSSSLGVGGCGGVGGSGCGGPGSGISPWGSSGQLPASASPSPHRSPLDMRDPRPVRRWSSLTRLGGGGGGEKPGAGGGMASLSSRHAGAGGGNYRIPDSHGSLDRGLLHGYRLHESQSSDGFLLARYEAQPAGGGGGGGGGGSGSCSRTDSCRSSPLKPSTLDLNYSALPESKPNPGLASPGLQGGQRGGGGGGVGGVGFGGSGVGVSVGGSPIQPAVRTQMWLSEQMEYRPGPDGCGLGLGAWQQEQLQRERMRQEAEYTQMLGGSPLPVNTLVKIKEGLLRQRELEIDRQKQQILQLHGRIRENELRAQQVLHNQRGRCDDPYILKTKECVCDSSPVAQQPALERLSPLCGSGPEGGELGRRLAAAELEALHLSEFLRQNTQKYTDDIKKLEDKMKTRDRYISSLKKKCQREQEQNLEKQQRIETLEKYLADLPSLDDVQSQAQQLEEVRGTAEALQERVSELERRLEESQTLLQEKEEHMIVQARREQELLATVQSLTEKVEQCLEDGVRLPMMDLRQLERVNTQLQEQHTHSSVLIDNQKKQIEKLTVELSTVEQGLQQEQSVSQALREQLQEKDEDLQTLNKTLQENQKQVGEGCVLRPSPGGAVQEAGPLLKEMSLCLLDLKALCNILTHRAQGKEPNLTLLLGIKSMGVSGEEIESPEEDGLRAKLREVCQLRKDIDDLRTLISDRYAQDMGDNCVTQ